MANVALVVIDTLRKDYFDDYFDWLPGIRFENAWSPGHYTIPAHGGMFTGRYPSETGVNSRSESLNCDFPVLPEVLNKAGYRTVAISGNPLITPIKKFDRGFSEFYFTGRTKTLDDNLFSWREEVKKSSQEGIMRDLVLLSKCLSSGSKTWKSIKYGWELNNDAFHSIEDTIKTVNQMSFDNNEFIFINIMDSHSPYKPPKSYRTTSYEKGTFRDRILAENEKMLHDKQQAYEDSVRYTSDRYEDLFNILETDFDYIITVSDHGELFGEYGTSKHYFGVYPELVHIPISIYTGENSIQINNKTVSLIDIYDTVLEMCDIDGKSRSKNLFEEGAGHEVITESHGLRPSHAERFKFENIGEDKLEEINKPLRGIAVPKDYYGYEDPSGEFIEDGHSKRPNPHDRLEKIISDIDPMDTLEETKEEIPEGMKEHLSDLGYM